LYQISDFIWKIYQEHDSTNWKHDDTSYIATIIKTIAQYINYCSLASFCEILSTRISIEKIAPSLQHMLLYACVKAYCTIVNLIDTEDSSEFNSAKDKYDDIMYQINDFWIKKANSLGVLEVYSKWILESQIDNSENDDVYLIKIGIGNYLKIVSKYLKNGHPCSDLLLLTKLIEYLSKVK